MNMKIIYRITSVAFLVCLLIGCTDDFIETNTDPKNLSEDQLDESEVALVARRAMFGTVYYGNDFLGPFQLGHSLFTDVYANYFATTAANFDSDQFTLVGRWLNGAYVSQMSDVAPELKFVLDFTEENGLEVENAIFKIWKVYFYHRVTDLWGPINYSNFGDLETTPLLFDSQQDIYSDFFEVLDEATSVLASNAGQTKFFLNSNQDMVFQGDLDKWRTFANSLRLRLAMRVKYVDPSLAQAEAEKAVAQGVMTDISQNAFIVSDDVANYRNSYNTITQWGEFRMSGDMESILKGYRDPRVSSFFAEAVQPDASDDPAGLTFNYEGLQNGQLKATKQDPNLNLNNSDMAPAYTEANAVGPNYPLIRLAEVNFLLAEGALEGWNMGGSAEEFYNQGVMASHMEYGLDGTDLMGNDYVTSTNVPLGISSDISAVSSVPVAYDATADVEYQLEQIITQKWIALYPDSEEAYAERRRTGYPTLYNRVNSLNTNIGVDEIPRRMPYTDVERNNNTAAVEDAINDPNKLGGPDNGTTKLWWDAKN